MLRIFVVLTLLLTPSLSSASTNLKLLCEGVTQDLLGSWEKVSTLFSIKDGTYKGEDTLGRQYKPSLVGGPVVFFDDEILFMENGIALAKIDRTTGQFTYLGNMTLYKINADIKCKPQKKMF